MSTRRIKAVFLAVLVLISCVFAGFTIFKERSSCMGIPVISADAVNKLSEIYDLDVNSITLNGERIPYDEIENTIYVSQPKSALSKYYNLAGKFECNKPDYSLYFINNKALNHLNSALKQSFPLTMIIVNGKSFMRVDVILTTISVMTLFNEDGYNSASKGNTVSGRVTIFSGFDNEVANYTTKSCNVDWRVRGNTTSVQSKQPYKLTLKDKNGIDNKDMNLLGLGSDDDWILNCLTMDDTRMKEKLFMDMWNAMAAETDYNYKMSTGDYVELIINNSYRGLYLLQRRLDAKYLGIDEDDASVKATDYTAQTVEEAYEFVTEPENTEEIYSMLGEALYGWGDNRYNLYNVIDTNITLQITAARDNYSKKNMYHVLKYTNGEYENFLVPWDTDQSMGVIFDDGFKYNFNSAVFDHTTSLRMETDNVMVNNPEYYTVALKRWVELRNGVYSDESIAKMIDRISTPLIESGAFERDTNLWGDRYGGDDTIENLRELMKSRARVIDFQYLGSIENAEE